METEIKITKAQMLLLRALDGQEDAIAARKGLPNNAKIRVRQALESKGLILWLEAEEGELGSSGCWVLSSLGRAMLPIEPID